MGKRYPGKNEGAENLQKCTVQYGENDLSGHSLAVLVASRGETRRSCARFGERKEPANRARATLRIEYVVTLGVHTLARTVARIGCNNMTICRLAIASQRRKPYTWLAFAKSKLVRSRKNFVKLREREQSSMAARICEQGTCSYTRRCLPLPLSLSLSMYSFSMITIRKHLD